MLGRASKGGIAETLKVVAALMRGVVVECACVKPSSKVAHGLVEETEIEYF